MGRGLEDAQSLPGHVGRTLEWLAAPNHLPGRDKFGELRWLHWKTHRSHGSSHGKLCTETPRGTYTKLVELYAHVHQIQQISWGLRSPVRNKLAKPAVTLHCGVLSVI